MKEDILQIHEENVRQINEKIEKMHVTINQKVDQNNEERKLEIAETNEKLEKTNETVIPVSYTHLDVYKRQGYMYVCMYVLDKKTIFHN